MPQARSQFRFGAALTSACLVLALTLAPTASPQSGVTDMLIVLKNQPARQILDSIASTSGTPRKLAEDDFRRLSGQAGVPHQMKAAAAQRLLTQVYAQTRQASAEIKAAIAPEQDILAGRLTGLGATAIRHYSALNMLEAQIPEAALAAVQQDPAVAEVIPVGANQKLLDDIEQGLTDPTNVMLASIENRASADPAFLRLIDRIIDDRDALVTAATDWGAFNTVTGSPDTALGSFGHLAVKAAGLNGGEPNLFSDSVSAAQPFRLYTGRGQGPFQSTLVWDRHFSDGLQPSLRNLDLFLYNNSDGAQLASSESPDKNVEQAPFNDAGEFVVKVKLQPAQDGSPAEEADALALSEQGFTVAQGPQLSVKCPSDCTVSNAGDLPAYNVTATAQGEDYNLGTIQPSSSASFTPRAAAVNTTVTSRSFGEVFSSSASAPDPCGGKWTVSPTFYNFPASGGGQSFTVTPPASNCYWKPDPVLGPFYTAFPSPTGVTVQVSPNTTSSPRSGYVVILASIYLPYATIPSFVNVASLGFSQGGGTTGETFDADGHVEASPHETLPLPITVHLTPVDGGPDLTAEVSADGSWVKKDLSKEKAYVVTLSFDKDHLIWSSSPLGQMVTKDKPVANFTVSRTLPFTFKLTAKDVNGHAIPGVQITAERQVGGAEEIVVTTKQDGNATVVLRRGVPYRITADTNYAWESNKFLKTPGTDTGCDFKSTDFVAIGTVRLSARALKQEDAEIILEDLLVGTTPSTKVQPFKGTLSRVGDNWTFQFWQGGLDATARNVDITLKFNRVKAVRHVSKSNPQADFNF